MSCDHKFIDSKHCLKCGWAPPPRRTRDEVEREELMAELAAANALLVETRRHRIQDKSEGLIQLELEGRIDRHLRNQSDAALLQAAFVIPKAVEPQPTDHYRAVLEAMGACPENVLETLANPASILGKWTAPLARAELARREAKRG